MLNHLIKSLCAQPVRVGHDDIHFIAVDSKHVSFAGQYNADTLTIDVSDQGGGPPQLVNTVLHELGHAIWAAFHIDPADREERIVATTATGWTQVYRDNPWLLDWIGDALHPEPQPIEHPADALHGLGRHRDWCGAPARQCCCGAG